MYIIVAIISGVMVANSRSVEGVTVQLDEGKLRTIVSEEIAKIPGSSGFEGVVPTAAEIAAEINVESADNALLNEFLESEFSVEYGLIEDAAEPFALDELEDHDYRVISDYLITLLSEGQDLEEEDGEYLMWVEFEKIDVKVTKLGLGEDEDKSARVTYEIEVEYELDEGSIGEIVQYKDLVVVYDVVFDEGDFSDEEVELVSIV